ncbi:MAG: SUMF1/EgtB/PvdO family nonheme iron enzyme [Deltaproteobacteria bacterium]|nr:SUMF1/EgtB/PvdO family nonheme iron enzyme [Deltaproteobacteria bacterium]
MITRARRAATAPRALLLAGLAFGATCERVAGDETQVEIEVATNFDPRELTSLRVVVSASNGAPVAERTFAPSDLRSAHASLGGLWSLSFAVVPAATSNAWRVDASVESHGRTLVSSYRRGTFTLDRKVNVRIVLDRRCIDRTTLAERTCPDDQTCGAGGLCSSSLAADDAPIFGCEHAGERLGCVSACGAPGEALCEETAGGSLTVGTCTPFRELPGDQSDNDCRPETPDDGRCGSSPREPREGMFDEETCVTGGSFRLGDADGVSPFADLQSRGSTLLSHRPSAVASRERPSRRVVVSAFWIDRFEVSVARFREYFEEVGEYEDTTGGQRVGCTFTPGMASRDEMPMNCVTWHDAQSFCAWDASRDDRRGRLPTEAEWEWIAGGDTERTFPWGEETPSCEIAYASLRWLDDLLDPCDPETIDDTALQCQFVGCDALANTAPRPLPEIATLPALPGDPIALYGLVGNVAEWMQDPWDPAAYERHCSERDCADDALADQNPVVEAPADAHAVRGGSFATPPGLVRVTARSASDVAADALGFRCVRED